MNIFSLYVDKREEKRKMREFKEVERRSVGPPLFLNNWLREYFKNYIYYGQWQKMLL